MADGKVSRSAKHRKWFADRLVKLQHIGVDPARVQGSGPSQKLYSEGPQRIDPRKILRKINFFVKTHIVK